MTLIKDPKEVQRLARILLGRKHTVPILEAVRRKPKTTVQIGEVMGVESPNISREIYVLKAAGFIVEHGSDLQISAKLANKATRVRHVTRVKTYISTIESFCFLYDTSGVSVSIKYKDGR